MDAKSQILGDIASTNYLPRRRTPTTTKRKSQPKRPHTRIITGKQLRRVGALRKPGSGARKRMGSALVPCPESRILRTNSKGERIGSGRTGDWDGGVVGAEDVELEAAERVPEPLIR